MSEIKFPSNPWYLEPDPKNPAQEFRQPWVLKTRGLTTVGSYVQGFIQTGVLQPKGLTKRGCKNPWL